MRACTDSGWGWGLGPGCAGLKGLGPKARTDQGSAGWGGDPLGGANRMGVESGGQHGHSQGARSVLEDRAANGVSPRLGSGLDRLGSRTPEGLCRGGRLARRAPHGIQPRLGAQHRDPAPLTLPAAHWPGPTGVLQPRKPRSLPLLPETEPAQPAFLGPACPPGLASRSALLRGPAGP